MKKYWFGIALLISAALLFFISREDLPSESQGLVDPPRNASAESKPPANMVKNGAEAPAHERGSFSLLAKDLTSQSDFGEFLSAARASPDGNDRSSAMSVANICTQLPSEEAIAERAELYPAGSSDRANLSSALRYSRAALAKFCAKGDALLFIDDYRANRISRGVMRRKVINPDESDSKQWQAVALSSPEKNSGVVDAWLKYRVESLATRSLSATEAQFLRDEIYRRLTGDTSSDSIRNLMRCAIETACPGVRVLDENSKQAMLLEADRIERLIRTQRWEEIL